ncbi:MAG: discoidin domain-containing protein [Ignavibacteriaceae bacterium]
MRYFYYMVVTLSLLFVFGCEKSTIIQPQKTSSVESAFKLSSDILIDSVTASSSIWPVTNLIDGDTLSLWSSNVDPSVNTTEWVSYYFNGLNNINYLEVYPRYGSNGALGFPVNFDIYWYNGSSWVLASSYVSFPTPKSGWVILPLSAVVNTNEVKIVATQLGVDDNNDAVFQLGEVEAGYDGQNRIVCINDSIFGPPIYSTYSPWVMHAPGWDRYRMYFGRNEIINGVNEDRIYLSENFGDGINNWGTPILMLSPGGTGQSALIHDPTVAIDTNSVWQMFYTGTDNLNGTGNQIFHANSSDGVNWTKQGLVNISGLPSQNGQYGYGEPSILYENGIYYLYFFSDATPTSNGTVYLATGTDGQNFSFYGNVSGMLVSAPEVRKYGSNYILVGSAGWFTGIVEQVSSSKTSFGSSFTQIFSTGPAGSWDYYHIGTPDILPDESRLYYSGTSNNWTSGSFMDDGKIGEVGMTF